MARLLTTSFGLNSLTDGMEFFRGASQSGSIVTSPVRSGSSGFAYRNNPSAGTQNLGLSIPITAGTKTVFERHYFRFSSGNHPQANALVWSFTAGDLATVIMRLRGVGATYRTSTAGGGTSGTGNRSGTAITPVVGDLLIVFCNASTNTNAAPTCSDNNGTDGTYALVGTALWGSSANIMSVFVRNDLMKNTTSTTVTVATGSNDAAEIVTVAVSGMLLSGASAIRQSNFQANQAGGGTPAPAFSSAAMANNMTLTACANSTATGSVLVPNASWTERQDIAQSTPTTGLEVATRDTGFTGTTITAGGTSATAFASCAVELSGPVGGLTVRNSADAVVGSPFYLNPDTWYCMEVKCLSSATVGTIDVLVGADGTTPTSVVSATGLNTQGSDIGGVIFGSGLALTHDWFVSDVAVNDTNGSAQTSYPGVGCTKYLRPGAAGGSTQWTRGGTDSGNNWDQVNEVTPNDATDYVQSGALNNEDRYAVTASGIQTGSAINVVAVHGRWANDVADPSLVHKMVLQAQSGTRSLSATFAVGVTTYLTDTVSSAKATTPPITLYLDPDGAAWVPSVLDAVQIGQLITTADVHVVRVTAVWIVVDYVPFVAIQRRTLGQRVGSRSGRD